MVLGLGHLSNPTRGEPRNNKDFTSGEDEIQLKIPISVNMNLISDGLELLHGTDLMAVMNNISEPLQQDDLTLR